MTDNSEVERIAKLLWKADPYGSAETWNGVYLHQRESYFAMAKAMIKITDEKFNSGEYSMGRDGMDVVFRFHFKSIYAAEVAYSDLKERAERHESYSIIVPNNGKVTDIIMK